MKNKSITAYAIRGGSIVFGITLLFVIAALCTGVLTGENTEMVMLDVNSDTLVLKDALNRSSTASFSIPLNFLGGGIKGYDEVKLIGNLSQNGKWIKGIAGENLETENVLIRIARVPEGKMPFEIADYDFEFETINYDSYGFTLINGQQNIVFIDSGGYLNFVTPENPKINVPLSTP